MISVGLLFVSLIPLGVLGFLVVSDNNKNHRLRTAIFTVTFLHEFILVSFPILHSVFIGFYFEHEMAIKVNSIDLLIVMIGEALFVSVFAIGVIVNRSKFINRKYFIRILSSKQERYFLYFLIIVGFFIYIIHFYSPPTTQEEAIAHSEGYYYSGTVTMFFAWFKGFFHFAALVASCLILMKVKNEKDFHWIIRILAISVLLLVMLMGLTAGIRGRILWVVSLLGIIGFIREKIWPFYFGAIIITLSIPFFVFLGGAYRSIYSTQAEIQISSWQMINILFREAGSSIGQKDSYNNSNSNFLHKFAERAQAPRNSVVLYHLFNDGSGALHRPISAAITTFVPKIIWPSKRPAGSINSSTYGSAIYIVRKIGHNSPIYNMGPYLASAHAYWEGGWIWLLFAGFITGLFWSILINFYESSGSIVAIVVILVFTAGVASEGLLTMFQPLFDIIRLSFVSVLPIILLKYLINILFSVKLVFSRRVQ
jgi:hypothetical protein